ncbi:MAG: hypothetical protein V2I67_18230, partial [Thermoanaerobaculales bacterium]|nr:hypothetical protein [Thermoanaerobaculales bacterium]
MTAIAGVFKDPLVIGALIGLAIALTGLRLPAWLDQTLQSLGAAVVGATTVAMAVSLPVLIWICAQIWP